MSERDRPEQKGPDKESGLFLQSSKEKATTRSISVAQDGRDSRLQSLQKTLLVEAIVRQFALYKARCAMKSTQKILEAIAELEAEALRCTRMADELREWLNSSENAGPEIVKHARSVVIQAPTRMHTNGEPNVSTLTASVAALSDHGQPMHIKELVNAVSDLRGVETPRASIESVLSTAVKQRKHGVMRTGPGVYSVRK